MADRTGQIDIERGQKTPVEVEELRRAGMPLDVRVPVAQSRYAALSIAGLLGAFIWTIIALGPMVFWAVVFVVGATTFIWLLVQASKWEYENDEGEWEKRVAPQDVVTAFLLVVFVGFVAWALWRVIAFIAPTWELPLWAVKAQAIASLLSLVFAVSFFLHLELAFVQELAQRSPFQEQAIWSAVEKLISGAREVKEIVREVPRPVPVYDYRTTNGANSTQNTKPSGGNGHKSKTVMSPGGEEVLVSDLVTFARLAPDIGTGFRTWQERGWDHTRWGAVLDVWAVFGVVEERQARHTSKMLVEDFDEAMLLLTGWLSPSPP